MFHVLAVVPPKVEYSPGYCSVACACLFIQVHPQMVTDSSAGRARLLRVSNRQGHVSVDGANCRRECY